MRFTAEIKNGKLDISEQDKIRYARWISRLTEGTAVEVEVLTVKYARSDKHDRARNRGIRGLSRPNSDMGEKLSQIPDSISEGGAGIRL